MRKQILAMGLLASVVVASAAQAQTPAPTQRAAPPAGGEPSMTMTTPAVPAASYTITYGELATVGVGAVAGATLFHATMLHGLTIVGAVVGGWLGDMYYGHYIAPKPAN